MALNDEQVAMMKERVNDTLQETCDILRKAETAAGAGGTRESYAPYKTGVKIRRGRPGTLQAAREFVVSEQLQGQTIWWLSFEPGVDVQTTDRVKIGSLTFHIIGILSPQTYEISRRVIARLVDEVTL